jgi:hypothetical protein
MGQSQARKERREQLRERNRNIKKLMRQTGKAKEKDDKLVSLKDAITSKALKVKETEGISKMYFCMNAENLKDSLIINYVGSESLIERIGLRTDVTLDNGVVKKNVVILLAEVREDNVVDIFGLDGSSR